MLSLELQMEALPEQSGLESKKTDVFSDVLLLAGSGSSRSFELVYRAAEGSL